MSIVLSYPKTGVATYTVTLRGPKLDNEELTDYGVVNHVSRSGEPKSVRPAGATTIVTNRYQFEAITKTLKDALYTMLEACAGLEISLVDHANDTWFGVISTPVIETITQDDTCSYNLSFDFIGVKQ